MKINKLNLHFRRLNKPRPLSLLSFDSSLFNFDFPSVPIPVLVNPSRRQKTKALCSTATPYQFSAQCNYFPCTRSASNTTLYDHITIGSYLVLWPFWNFLHEPWQINWSQNL